MLSRRDGTFKYNKKEIAETSKWQNLTANWSKKSERTACGRNVQRCKGEDNCKTTSMIIKECRKKVTKHRLVKEAFSALSKQLWFPEKGFCRLNFLRAKKFHFNLARFIKYSYLFSACKKETEANQQSRAKFWQKPSTEVAIWCKQVNWKLFKLRRWI